MEKKSSVMAMIMVAIVWLINAEGVLNDVMFVMW